MKLHTVRALLTAFVFSLPVAVLVYVSVASRSSVRPERLQLLVARVGSASLPATAVDVLLTNGREADSRVDGDGDVEKQGPSLPSSPLLCLFTSFKPLKKKYPFYANTLRNWVSVDNGSGQLVPLLYYTSNLVNSTNQMEIRDRNEPLLTMARRLGWRVAAAPRVTKSGVPYLNGMFRDAMERLKDCTFYGYSNGDILYTGGLLSTVRAVEKALDRLGTTMIIGRRTNVNMTLTTSTLYLPDDVERTARRGQLFRIDAEDYFITSSAAAANNRSAFPWHRMANLVIGRPAYDNYLVASAIKNNVSVVDATNSLTAVHQTDVDGNFAGSRSIDSQINKELIGAFDYYLGVTESSQFFTAGGDGSSGEVAIHMRKVETPKPIGLSVLGVSTTAFDVDAARRVTRSSG